MRALLLLMLVAVSACANTDDPTQVIDLRVLGMAVNPPEVLATGCSLPERAGALPASFDVKALVIDIAGNGRSLDWELFICEDVADRNCSKVDERVPLKSGSQAGGDWTIHVTQQDLFKGLPPGDPFAAATTMFTNIVTYDQYKSLGGLRVPLMLHITGADTGEEIWAQKLFVLTCPYVPGMTANIQPELPGITLDGHLWTEADTPPLNNNSRLKPVDFTDLQETFIVPSYTLEPVQLVESWRVSWVTNYGRLSTYETGGASFTNSDELDQRTDWTAPDDSSERDVAFWISVRDGRGGESWVYRVAHYAP